MVKFILIFLVSLRVFAATGGQLKPQEYFVAANGNDSNPGTQASPWLTVAKVNSTSLPVGARVYFRGGDTFYATLTNSSSGTQSRPIVYCSYGNGRATISGGVVVTTWTLIDAPNNIWRAAFSSATGRPRAIWVNNRRIIRSRTTSVGSFTQTGTGWNSTLLAAASQPDQVEAHMRFAYWAEKKVQVSAATGTTISIDAHVKSLLTAEGALFDAINNPTSRATLPYEIENWYEQFVSSHTAGTFYQDRSGNFLYLVPPSGVSDPNTATVVAGVRENVITFTGAADVIVGNLAVRHTTDLRAYHADAYIDAQTGGCIGSDFRTVAVPGGTNWDGTLTTQEGAVTLNTCTRVTLRRTLLCGLGGQGVKIVGASPSCELDGVIVRDTGGSNLQIGEPGFTYTQLQTTPVSPQLPQPSLTSVHDSIFHGCGVDFISHANIIYWYGTGATISYNIVRDSNYSNMALGWGFGYYEANTIGGDTVERNEVYNGMALLNDGAGIYANGVNETTRTIQFNWIHHISGSDSSLNFHIGLYMDGGAYRNIMQNNVVSNVQDLFYNLNSDDNGSSKDVPRTAPRNSMINNSSDNANVRTDGSGGQNTITGNNGSLSNAAAIAAGQALGTGPRAGYASVLAEDAALVTY